MVCVHAGTVTRLRLLRPNHCLLTVLLLFGAEKAEERKKEQDILYERQLAKERAAGAP